MAKDSSINTLFKDKVCPTPGVGGNWGKNTKPLSDAPEAAKGELDPPVQIMKVEGGDPGGTSFGPGK